MRKLLDLKEGGVLVFHTTVWYCIPITSCFKKLIFFSCASLRPMVKLQIGDLAITDQCRGGVSVRGYRLDFYVYNNESFRSQLIDIIGTCRSLLVSFHLYEGWKDRYPLFISLYG